MVEGEEPSTTSLRGADPMKAKATVYKDGKKPKGHRDGKFTRW